MEKNMAIWDRVVRIIVAVIFLWLAITNGGWYWILGVIGIVFIVTAAIGFCPLYKVLGFKTG
ncbi:YgaP family membrane protein [Aquifex sp.]